MQRQIRIILLSLSILIQFGLNERAAAQTIKIDKNFHVIKHGRLVLVNQQEKYTGLFLARFVEIDGRVTLCGAYDGFMSTDMNRQLKGAKVWYGGKAVLKNLRFLTRLSTFVAKKTPYTLRKLPNGRFLPDALLEPSLKLYKGKAVGCAKTKVLWDKSFSNQIPVIKMRF